MNAINAPLKVARVLNDAMTIWPFDIDTAIIRPINDPEYGFGLMARALPDDLINAIDDYGITDEDAFRLIPPHAPTLLMAFDNVDTIDSLIHDLLVLRSIMTASGAEQADLPKPGGTAGVDVSGTIHVQFDPTLTLTSIMNGLPEVAAAPEAVDVMAKATDDAPSLDMPLTKEQAINLTMVGIKLLDIDPIKFDQTKPYAVAADGSLLTPAKVYELAEDPSQFKAIDVAGFAALAYDSPADWTWHDFTENLFGITDRHNGNVWSYLFGPIIAGADGNTPTDASRRIAGVITKAIREGKFG